MDLPIPKGNTSTESEQNISVDLPDKIIDFDSHDVGSSALTEILSPQPYEHKDDLGLVPNLTGRIKVQKGPLHSGGFCDVYTGELMKEGSTELVAMKLLRVFNTEAHVIKMKKKFRREVSLWCFLRHPYVLPFYGTCALDEFRLFMVSPWAEGGNSLEYLRQNPGTYRERLLWQVSSALEYLHSGKDTPKIVHGDLKADNVLISAAGNALLCDFGLSRHVEGLISISGSSSGLAGGHSRFMAPELIVPSTKDVAQTCKPTPESDVFAFASLMLQIYTEKLPFSNIPEVPALFKIAHGENPPRPTELIVLERGLDDYLWALMENCWQYSPSKRPSIKEVAERIASHWQFRTNSAPSKAIKATPRQSTSVSIRTPQERRGGSTPVSSGLQLTMSPNFSPSNAPAPRARQPTYQHPQQRDQYQPPGPPPPNASKPLFRPRAMSSSAENEEHMPRNWGGQRMQDGPGLRRSKAMMQPRGTPSPAGSRSMDNLRYHYSSNVTQPQMGVPTFPTSSPNLRSPNVFNGPFIPDMSVASPQYISHSPILPPVYYDQPGSRGRRAGSPFGSPTQQSATSSSSGTPRVADDTSSSRPGTRSTSWSKPYTEQRSPSLGIVELEARESMPPYIPPWDEDSKNPSTKKSSLMKVMSPSPGAASERPPLMTMRNASETSLGAELGQSKWATLRNKFRTRLKSPDDEKQPSPPWLQASGAVGNPSRFIQSNGITRKRSASSPSAYAGPEPAPQPLSKSTMWGNLREEGQQRRSSIQSMDDSSDYSSPQTVSPFMPLALQRDGRRPKVFNVSPNDLTKSESSMRLNVHYGDDMFKFVIIVPRWIEHEDLLQRLGRKLRLCGIRSESMGMPLRVKYQDEDGDFVSLATSDDMKLAFDVVGNALTLHVS